MIVEIILCILIKKITLFYLKIHFDENFFFLCSYYVVPFMPLENIECILNFAFNFSQWFLNAKGCFKLYNLTALLGFIIKIHH